jgi:hypothetical protein
LVSVAVDVFPAVVADVELVETVVVVVFVIVVAVG